MGGVTFGSIATPGASIHLVSQPSEALSMSSLAVMITAGPISILHKSSTDSNSHASLARSGRLRLRPRRDGQYRSRGAPEQGDEVAPPDHSMTSLARARSV